MAGRNHTEETKERMRAAHLGKPRNYPTTRAKHTKATKAKIRKALGRPVQCVELNLTFDSVLSAAEWCIQQGLTTSIECRKNINRAIRLKTPTVFGYHWKSIINME